MQGFSDTIVAVATAPGEAALAVVRMSGPQAVPIAARFVRRSGSPLIPLQIRRATLCQVLDEDGSPFEQAVVTWYAAPQSYTGEDVLELSTHGGAMASRLVLEQCLRHGARMAQPGEFTLRAFLAGRMDLSQAEAVIDTVHAQTRAGIRMAHRQLSGKLSGRVREIRELVLDALARVEAAVDFPDDVDDPDRSELANDLLEAFHQTKALGDQARAGRIYREGIRVAIMGRPNVGKSSLLNALLREDRAIVTAVPGTTRDVVEDSLCVGGVPIRALDTAGLRTTSDPVERIGVERALASIRTADLCLLVLDRSEDLQDQDWDALEQTFDARTVIVLNKCDLPGRWSGFVDAAGVQLNGRLLPIGRWPFPPSMVEAAAALPEGLDRVEQALLHVIFEGRVIPADALDAGGARHGIALEQAAQSLREASRTAASDDPLDLISIDLRGALHTLGTITGETATEDLLHAIFSRFCIGK